MAISEQQLDTWSKQGPTAQFTATYEILKGVLEAPNAPYHARDYTIFLQGSYKNDTNVYGDSDVDVVICLNETFYTDLSNLTEEERILWNAARSPADYSLATFKAEVIKWLSTNFGDNVKVGSKAVLVKGTGSRRDADVLVCAKLRRYSRFRSWNDQAYVEGICFFRSDGQRIDNFPKQHSDNCTAKHQGTDSWFKHTVRVYKNLRNTLVEKGLIQDGLAPSYFLEGLLYNVPTSQFGGSEQSNFIDTLSWLTTSDRSKFLCANEQYYLLHATSPVTWRAENCAAFLKAANTYWAN